MVNKNIILAVACVTLFGSSILSAKPNNDNYDERDYKEEKINQHKQKEIPHGLQKKLDNGERLPAGWEKKLAKGQIVDDHILHSGRILNTNLYPNVINSDIYQVENKIFRISRDTKEILDILK